MKHIKRITAMVMALMILLSSLPSMTVSAATEGVNTTIDPSYRCYKGSDIGTAGTAPIGNPNYYWHYDSTGTYLNCPIRFMKEKGTNMPVYCIEAGKTFEGGYTYKTTDLTDSPYWTSLSATARAGITYTTMYGYPVNNYGTANCDAYAATQTIIWEFEKGYRNLTGRTNSYYYDLMIKGSPAENAYNRLAADIIAHNKRPSFAYSSSSAAAENSVELKYNASAGTWSATLLDSNGVLSGYRVTSSGGITATKSGNSLILASSSEISGSVSIELARPLPTTGQSLLALYSTSSQNALVGQLSDPVTSFLTVTTEDLYGKVSIEKTDEAGTKLTGVEFGIYSDSSCTSIITTMTTTNGTAVSGDINIALYPTVYVKEKAMTGEQSAVYDMSTKVYTVNLVKNQTVSATNGTPLVNTWKDGKVRVIKQNEVGTALSGVVFGVYSDSACQNLLTTIVTGSDGTGTSADINVGTSGSRVVYVKEISMTAAQQNNYSMNTTVYPVTISAGKTVTANGGSAIINNWLPGRISVTKTNSAGEHLSGAQFTAYTDKACSDVLVDTVGKAVIITTGADGCAVSSDIYVGKSGSRTIYVRETALDNPDSDIIALNPTVFSVVLTPNTTTPVNDGSPVVNEYKPGRVKVVKENENGNRLAGVTFSVYNDSACRNLLTTIVTDENGTAVSGDIPIGADGKRVVYVRETAMTEEQEVLYELSATVYRVVLYPNQTVQANNGRTVINLWEQGKFSLTKANENGDSLEGVTFEVCEDEECLTPLLGADGKPVFVTTDKDGNAVSDEIEVSANGSRKLYIREYSISEIHGDKYELDTTVYPVVVTAGMTAQVNDGKEIVNKWLPARVSLMKSNPAGGSVAGAQFTAYADAECTTVLTDKAGNEVILVTDSVGYAVSNDIKVGKDGALTIYLKETAVADDTVKLNEKIFEVKLVAGETTSANNAEAIIDEWKPGRIELYKVNEASQPLEGVTFGVYENAECATEAVTTLVTDSSGYAVSGELELNKDGSRTVYVKELAMTEEQSKRYDMNPAIFEVTVRPNEIVCVNNGKVIVNEWLGATLSLTKQDEDGNLMSGVVFAAFDDEECTESALDTKGENVMLTTDENGCAKSVDIQVGKDGTRIVYVKEISMTVSDTDVYQLNGEVFEVELTAGQNTEVSGGEPIVNEFKTAPVKIRKSDFTTAEGVPGAQIQIFDSAGELVYEGVTLEDGNTEEIELRVGKYTFVETIAPAGYVLNKTVFEFSVNPDKTITGDCEVQDKPTEWTITKSDITTAEPLAGAEITIYNSEGNEVYKDITKEDGTITAFYLPAGVYTFKETLAPEGYVINEEIFTFTVDAEGNVTGDNSVTDRRIKGNIKVIKTDENTGEKLAGAVFGLFLSDGKTKLVEGTTGADGYVTFTDLEYGEYVIKELDAPVGFLMKKTEFKVKIAEDGKTVEITVSNSREPVITPPTGDSSDNLCTALVIMVISAGVLGILWFIRSGRKMLDEQDKKKWWRDRRYRYSGWE